MIRLTQIGDTIVEVLIAMLVISTMLGGAFVSAHRSLNGTRQSQERVEALKGAESQVEKLKMLAASGSGQLFDASAPNTFCVNNGATITRVNVTGIKPLTAEDFGDATYHPPACTITPPGGISYYPAIERNFATRTFKVYMRWERSGGGSNEELTLAYRIYQ